MSIQQMALGLLHGQLGDVLHDVPGVLSKYLLGGQIGRCGCDQMGSPDQT